MSGDRLTVRAFVAGEHTDAPRLDIELVVGDGITAVTGPSGAGKTTLLATIAGLVTPSRGRIVLDTHVFFDSTQQTNVAPHQRRVALVFQSLALFPHLNAWQNVAYGLPPTSRAQRRARALQWLQRVRAESVANRLPASLSGGEAQRVALARALAAEPRALMLDEPFSALDLELRQDLGDELRALVAGLGIPTLLVTHDRQDATRLASQIITLSHGRLAPR